MGSTHYVNVDFDLGLRSRPGWTERPQLVRQVRELSLQALLGTSPGDAALVRADVPDEFLDHLDRRGLSVPRVCSHPDSDPTTRLRPFGWSAEAMRLNRGHEQPVEHPATETIARVNSRSFALELESALWPGGMSGKMIGRPGELNSFLSAAAPTTEWVIKAEHGNGGLANRRLRSSVLAAADRRFVERVFAEDDRLLVEPWLVRERDWCVVFDVPFDAGTLRIHETFCTRDGALIGSLFEPDGPLNTPWTGRLAETAECVARRLRDEGYFGPACFDAFSWVGPEGVELRSLVDLNCRRTMSEVAYRTWRQLAPRQTCYYRFFNRRKLELPEDLTSAVEALGERRYERSSRRGILLASPIEFGKLPVLFVAENRSEVFALEAWFRDRFET